MSIKNHPQNLLRSTHFFSTRSCQNRPNKRVHVGFKSFDAWAFWWSELGCQNFDSWSPNGPSTPWFKDQLYIKLGLSAYCPKIYIMCLWSRMVVTCDVNSPQALHLLPPFFSHLPTPFSSLYFTFIAWKWKRIYTYESG